jgi:hypothetical protein
MLSLNHTVEELVTLRNEIDNDKRLFQQLHVRVLIDYIKSNSKLTFQNVSEIFENKYDCFDIFAFLNGKTFEKYFDDSKNEESTGYSVEAFFLLANYQRKLNEGISSSTV